MRIRAGFAIVLAALLGLAGCASAPPFSSVAKALPPVPQGEARIFVYRWLEPYDTLSWTRLYLNGAPVAETQPGTVLYRDVAPGEYRITVDSEGTYPNQFKTVVLRAGETDYVRIESLRMWVTCPMLPISGCGDTFTVNIINPVAATGEMAHLRLIRG